MSSQVVPIVPHSSVGEGNTNSSPSTLKKQVSPAIRWCFTYNNYTEQDISSIVPIIQERCRLAIFGKEIGESGTPHLQGYIEFNVKARPMSVFKGGTLVKIHWEKAIGDKYANINYCSKEDKKAFCWKCKIKKPLEIIAEEGLFPWQRNIVNMINEEPDNRKVYWYWSHKGNIGKTCFCKFLTVNYGAMCLHGKGSDVRNGVVQYLNDQGDTPDLVVYPIPRCHDSDYVSYEAIENIKDMYFYSGKYEGGMVCGNSPHLIIFANQPPKEEKLSEDRWEVVCIDPENAELNDFDSCDEI